MIDYILERIKNRTVTPPENLTVEQLNSWLLGYGQCQMEILKLIRELEDERY